MSTVLSTDGTAIAFTGEGQGSHFTVFTYDRRGETPYSSTARHPAPRSPWLRPSVSPVISKLAVYEPPFIVDDTRPPMSDGFLDELNQLVAQGRNGGCGQDVPAAGRRARRRHRGDAPYAGLVQAQGGRPHAGVRHHAHPGLPSGPPVDGRPGWQTPPALLPVCCPMRFTGRCLENHMVKPRAIAPVLTEFFAARD